MNHRSAVYCAAMSAACYANNTTPPAEVVEWLVSGVGRAVTESIPVDVALGLRLPGTRQRSILRSARLTMRNSLLEAAGELLAGSARARAMMIAKRLRRLSCGFPVKDEADRVLLVSMKHGPIPSAETIRKLLGENLTFR